MSRIARLVAAGVIGGARAATPWYLAGGLLSAAQVVASYQAIGAASAAASYVNLANPGTYDLTTDAAPTFDTADGWTGNGTSQYLDTGFVPNANTCILIRFSNVANTGRLYGEENVPGAAVYCRPDTGSSTAAIFRGGGASTKSPAMTAGVVGSLLARAYRNGTYDGATGAWTATALQSISLFCRHNGMADYSQFLAGKIQAVVIFNGNGLSDAQLDAIAAALNTSMAALPL